MTMKRGLTSRGREGRKSKGQPDGEHATTLAPDGACEETHPQGLVFTDALYYPFIEIADEGWLRTAVLYWNTISTIVPESVRPFRSASAKILHDAGVLQSLVVHPGMPELADVADEVVDYLGTQEGRQALFPGRDAHYSRIHSDKFWRMLSYQIEQMVPVHSQKMSPDLCRVLQRMNRRTRGGSPWVEVPPQFGGYYMTLLATRLAASKGRSLLTDDIAREALAVRASLDSVRLPRRPAPVPRSVAEGLLATTVLSTVNIGPETPIQKILSFREKHAAALGEFRSTLRELLTALSVPRTPEALSSYVQSLYRDKVTPAVERLRARLRDHRLTLGLNNLKATTLLSAAPTALGTVLSTVGLGPFALFAGAGLSIVVQTTNYTLERGEILRRDPFSYLLAAEKRFGRKPPSPRHRKH
jgi:hypothetical protein